jgi:hypothetical protein
MNFSMHTLNYIANGVVVLPLNLTDHLVFKNASLVAIVHTNRKQAITYTPEAVEMVKEIFGKKDIFGEDINITEAPIPQDLCLLTWNGLSPFQTIREEQKKAFKEAHKCPRR